MYFSSCLFSKFCLVYSLLLSVPVCLICLVLPCLVGIKDYYFEFIHVCVLLVSPCCVHRDRRPDQFSKRRPRTSFCFVHFLKVFCLFLFVFPPRLGSRCSSSRPSQLLFGVGVRRDRRESAGRSSVKFAGRLSIKFAGRDEVKPTGRGSLKPAGRSSV